MSGAVWVIGRNHWPRALLAAELLERGYEAYGFPDLPGALLSLYQAGQSAPSVAVFDLAGMEAEPAELRRFLDRGSRLLGITDAVASRGPLALEVPWADLIRRPCTIGAIADRIGALLSA